MGYETFRRIDTFENGALYNSWIRYLNSSPTCAPPLDCHALSVSVSLIVGAGIILRHLPPSMIASVTIVNQSHTTCLAVNFNATNENLMSLGAEKAHLKPKRLTLVSSTISALNMRSLLVHAILFINQLGTYLPPM